VSKVDLRLQCGMPCSKLEVSTVQHGTLSGAGYLHQSHVENVVYFAQGHGAKLKFPRLLFQAPNHWAVHALRPCDREAVSVIVRSKRAMHK
jgi:hypothetical protein